MHIGSKNTEVEYTMDGVVLEAADQEKDLGVYITNNCKPSVQCSKAAQKAMNSLRVIRRTFKFMTKEVLLSCTKRTYHRDPTWSTL